MLSCTNIVYCQKTIIDHIFFLPWEQIDPKTFKNEHFLVQITLRGKKIAIQMKLSRPLTQMTIAFIDNWITLKDSPKYEDAVVNCLRSLSSKIQLCDPNASQMKTQYNWKNDWKLSKPIRMDKAGQDLLAFKPNLEAIKKQERKRQIQL